MTRTPSILVAGFTVAAVLAVTGCSATAEATDPSGGEAQVPGATPAPSQTAPAEPSSEPTPDPTTPSAAGQPPTDPPSATRRRNRRRSPTGRCAVRSRGWR